MKLKLLVKNLTRIWQQLKFSMTKDSTSSRLRKRCGRRNKLKSVLPSSADDTNLICERDSVTSGRARHPSKKSRRLN